VTLYATVWGLVGWGTGGLQRRQETRSWTENVEDAMRAPAPVACLSLCRDLKTNFNFRFSSLLH
jgi:hypothetical protein